MHSNGVLLTHLIQEMPCSIQLLLEFPKLKFRVEFNDPRALVDVQMVVNTIIYQLKKIYTVLTHH